MNIYFPISGWPIWFAGLLALLAFCLGLWRAPWRLWARSQTRQHLGFGAVLGMGVFGALSVNVEQVFYFHPLLITSSVFVFGLRISLVLMGLALIITHLVKSIPFANLGVNYLLAVLVPATFNRLGLWCIERIHIKNVFVYILGGGFVGGMLTMLVVMAMGYLVTAAIGGAVFERYQANLLVPLLLIFPEGFLNGAIVSTLTIFAPHLVKTYDDHFYLDED